MTDRGAGWIMLTATFALLGLAIIVISIVRANGS
jgi:hypothetical protein